MLNFLRLCGLAALSCISSFSLLVLPGIANIPYSCKPYFFKNGLMFNAEAGSQLVTTGSTIALTQGRMVVLVGKTPITVKTSFGRLVLPKNTASIVQEINQSNEKILRVDNLSGAALSLIADSIHLSNGSGSETLKGCNAVEIVARSSTRITEGEELLLVTKSISEVGLVPVDGVPRKRISKSTFDSTTYVIKNSIDRLSMVQRERLLTYVEFYSRAKYRVRKLQKSLISGKPLRLPNNSPNSAK